MTTVHVSGDIVWDDAAFAGLPQPIVLTRNVTLVGEPLPATGHYPTVVSAAFRKVNNLCNGRVPVWCALSSAHGCILTSIFLPGRRTPAADPPCPRGDPHVPAHAGLPVPQGQPRAGPRLRHVYTLPAGGERHPASRGRSGATTCVGAGWAFTAPGMPQGRGQHACMAEPRLSLVCC